ncbi:MAG: radical SAM protein [Bacteroidales bacterium]
MLDRYNRKINYLRISVTDRCNLRCYYCMPEKDPKLLRHEDILTFEEIQQVATVAASLGIDKIRLTGGEPLVRKDIVELVSMIAAVPGVNDLSMTTNAVLLGQFAKPLAKAGLQRINVSLDTLDPEKFRRITRGGDIQKVFSGIEAAKDAGISPVKINCVRSGDATTNDMTDVKNYCEKHDLQVRYIQQMDLKAGEFSVVEGGTGGDCKHCNRLRLTSDGYIKPCLFSDLGYNVRTIGIQQALDMALSNKPEKGSVNLENCFHNIGG